ncbi:hypothetical protein DPMN_051229 [Dreissena polymorpha]|uniref:Uncharacterized protein n=1 Tax=Dreissena polymorpha TaxID=45954 RepID=A0A9D4HNQ8_DREPO|nr:hypothetical protein DPMN_051229 [Dreissena polymorpha]
MSSEDIRHFCGKIDGLAFLPFWDVQEGMTVFKGDAPECMAPVTDYIGSCIRLH